MSPDVRAELDRLNMRKKYLTDASFHTLVGYTDAVLGLLDGVLRDHGIDPRQATHIRQDLLTAIMYGQAEADRQRRQVLAAFDVTEEQIAALDQGHAQARQEAQMQREAFLDYAEQVAGQTIEQLTQQLQATLPGARISPGV